MKTLAWPDAVAVAPGESGLISVAVTNSSSVIDAYRVQVFGLDPSWVEIEPARLSLFPGETANVAVNLRLPPDYPASQRTLTVNVASDDDPSSFSLNQVELAVSPKTRTSLRVDPIMVTAGRRATFGLVVGNEGNAPVRASAYAIDPEELTEFTFEPLEVVVAPGREQVIEVTAQGGRSWFGPPRPRTFTFGVEAEEAVEALGTFVQRPRIGRWMLTLLGLLTAAVVFAVVLYFSINSVVDDSRVPTAVIDAALASGSAEGAFVPADPATVSGSLVSRTTGRGFSGATAELFVDGDAEPRATSATDDNGAFSFSNLGAGTYLLRISGSGTNEIWYGNTPTSADSTRIEVPPRTGEEIRKNPTYIIGLNKIEIGGVPVPVEGTVDIDDPSGVTITLLAPGQADQNTPGVVATVEVGPDGSFVLPDVPSPGAYEMAISKPGFATETRAVVLQPGQPLSGVEISLRPGNGVIKGTVNGPGGPLGGATVVATDGTNRIETVSFTEGQIGDFTLRDLAVPGQYTVTVTLDGYSRETRTVALDTTTPEAQFSVQLIPATGSVTGRVLVNGETARGLTVTITGGDVNRTTAVVSQGSAEGTYSFLDLPTPRTYTLRFSGAGTIPQVRVVDLDPLSTTQDQTGIDVSLSPERTSVRGVIKDVDGSPATQATVRLTDGADELVMLTADEPIAGHFEFANIAPGAYTLTASRIGTVPVVILVNVSATNPLPEVDVQLGQQASLSGRVVADDVATRPYTVKLYEPSLFPVTPKLTTTTDSSGTYAFSSGPDPASELDAPSDYVIAVFASEDASDPIDSEVVRTQPGADVAVPDFLVAP